MDWSSVGSWIKENAGTGASLVGSLLTGNVPGAVAAGVSLVSGATGTDDPDKAMQQLQGNPDALVKLKELAYRNEDSIRRHIEEMERLKLEDAQARHRTTQETIRAGDVAEDSFVRRTRPGQSWVSLFAALAYVFVNDQPDVMILGALLTLPWAYAGLRQVGKGVDSVAGAMKARRAGGKP
ncbi:hypothetical protein ABWH88_02025 [Marinobacter adhaerens]|uniref:hypothetical protein n=1 Tax=Marinobacter adhaerens TaxID=1033846 RepID=UPI0035CF2CA9